MYIQGEIIITGATQMECHTIDDVFSCLETGLALRHTGPMLNQLSSRSHGIFTLYMQQAWTQGFFALFFCFHFKKWMMNCRFLHIFFKMDICMKFLLNSILSTWLDRKDLD